MYDLVPGDAISGSIAFNGFYELSLSRHIMRLAWDGGLFVDVGANMGYFSLLWVGANTSNTAIAIEASPRNINLVENNIARNGFSDRIALVPKAVGDRDGDVSFDLGPAGQTGWGGMTFTAGEGSVVVAVARLDGLLGDGEIAVLKIDVEGADTLVLKGCERLLRSKRIRKIFFEQNARRMAALGVDPREAFIYLRDLDYICKPSGPRRRRGRRNEWMAYPKG